MVCFAPSLRAIRQLSMLHSSVEVQAITRSAWATSAWASTSALAPSPDNIHAVYGFFELLFIVVDQDDVIIFLGEQFGELIADFSVSDNDDIHNLLSPSPFPHTETQTIIALREQKYNSFYKDMM